MTSYCFLDQFPVEILHILFDYIPIPELHITYFNVSDYINASLLSYPISLLNFQSFTQYHIDFICHHIKPDQIISLTLSDDIDGQSVLFFSYFHIEQFIRLRSLTLFNIDHNSFEFIFPNINKLTQLHSFAFHMSKNYRLIVRDYKPIKLILLSQLNHLTLFNIEGMTLQSYSRLRHLKISECSTIELKRISSEIPQITSLNICLQGDPRYIEDLSSFPKLTRLILKNDAYMNTSISMNLIEKFLPNLLELKHFELQADNGDGFDDGQRWERLTKSLITLNFKFRIKNVFRNFNSFRTSFWLKEKKWYVLYNNGHLYTIPRFAPVKTNTNNLSHITSSRLNTILHERITKLILSTESFNDNYHFPNVEILKIYCTISIERLSNIIDLNKVKHLILSSRISVSKFLLMLPVMPFINELTIAGHLAPFLIEELQDNIIEQIRILNLGFCYFETESTTEILCHLFPCIEYLNVSLINSTNDIVCFIQPLKYLLNASFGINSIFKKDKEKTCQELQMSIDRKYTCQIVHSTNQSTLSYINIWLIDHQSFSSFLATVLRSFRQDNESFK